MHRYWSRLPYFSKYLIIENIFFVVLFQIKSDEYIIHTNVEFNVKDCTWLLHKKSGGGRQRKKKGIRQNTLKIDILLVWINLVNQINLTRKHLNIAYVFAT